VSLPDEIAQRDPCPIGKVIPLRRRRTATTRAEFAARSANTPVIDAERFRAEQDAAVDSELRDPYGR
jgi:hypothetical protein